MKLNFSKNSFHLDLTVAGYLFNNDNKLLLIHHKKLDKWLPIGGHIDPNESPDDALIREMKEEVNLDIEILNIPKVKITGSMIKNLATPFYVNIHNVGDHNHCGMYYICKAKNPDNIEIKKDEVNDYAWFNKDELKNSKKINTDVIHQCLMAFEKYGKLI